LRGRPRNRWQDEVRDDGRIVSREGWQEKVHNREKWKKLLRTARNRRVLHIQMEQNITYIYIYIYVSQEECARLREGVPYVKVYRYNPKHLCPKLNFYADNGQRSLKL